MRALILLLAAAPARAGLVTITDTLKTPMGGTFGGRVVIALAGTTAQPLYNSAGDTLTGWEVAVTVTNGVFSIQLEANDTITPAGTSYRVRMIPSNGTRETLENWVVDTSAIPVKVATLRRTTVPTPTVTLTASQFVMAAGSLLYGASNGYGAALAPGTNGHVLTLSGGYPAWAASTGGVTSITGTANQITASASTGAVTLSLPSRIVTGTNSPSTDDTALLITRAATNPLSSGGSHAVRDESTYVASGTGGYASFDAIPVMSGALAYGHLHSFQARPNFGGSTSVDQLAGVTFQPTISGAGTVTVSAGVVVDDALGAGPITTQYGLLVKPLSRGTGNYGVYVQGSNPSYFGGNVQSGGTVQGTAMRISAGFTTYGALASTDASGNFLSNPNLTIINGLLQFTGATADIKLGGTTTSFPMIKRSAATIAFRLADDSADANVSFGTATGALAGNASTATALASTVASGRLWIGQGTGVPTSGSLLTYDTSLSRLGLRNLTDPTANTNANMGIYPNGTATQSTITLYNNSSAGSAQYAQFVIVGGGETRLLTGANTGSAGDLAIYPGGIEKMRLFRATGDLAIGTTTDLGYGLHAANKGTNGNLLVFDATATTGTSKALFVAGQGQSGNILEVRGYNATPGSGTLYGGISSTGYLTFSGVASSSNGTLASAKVALSYDSPNDLKLTSDAYIAFSSSTSIGGSRDLGIARSSAGTGEWNNGTIGTYRDFIARIHIWSNGTEGTCAAGLRGQVVMVQGGAGVADTLRVCRKDVADAYAWTALY